MMFDKHRGYTRFGWVGNSISDDHMAVMYRIKERTKKPISKQVAEAVARYITTENVSK